MLCSRDCEIAKIQNVRPNLDPYSRFPLKLKEYFCWSGFWLEPWTRLTWFPPLVCLSASSGKWTPAGTSTVGLWTEKSKEDGKTIACLLSVKLCLCLSSTATFSPRWKDVIAHCALEKATWITDNKKEEYWQQNTFSEFVLNFNIYNKWLSFNPW